jgi:hypothetical protein
MAECTYCFGTGEHFDGKDVVPCKRCPEGEKKKKEKEKNGETGDKLNATQKKRVNT